MSLEVSGGLQMALNYTTLRLCFPRLDVFRFFWLILMRNNKVINEIHIDKSNNESSVLILLMLVTLCLIHLTSATTLLILLHHRLLTQHGGFLEFLPEPMKWTPTSGCYALFSSAKSFFLPFMTPSLSYLKSLIKWQLFRETFLTNLYEIASPYSLSSYTASFYSIMYLIL